MNTQKTRVLNSECNNKTCPWWTVSLLSGRLRRLLHNPQKILGRYIRNGMVVLDCGCGMGFFAMDAAELVGKDGKVLAVDIQEENLSELMKRMKARALDDRVIPIQCKQKSLQIEAYNGTVDFAYAFMMVHEVDDPEQLFQNIYDSLKPNGRLLIAEPLTEVSEEMFLATIQTAEKISFSHDTSDNPEVHMSRKILLKKS